MEPMKSHTLWQGMIPPQYLFANRRFAGIALEPPDHEPGSWIGAGKALFDSESEQFLLTARPRRAEGGVRGYAADIYRSRDGVKFNQVVSLTKEQVTELSSLAVHSIEGTQLMKSPLTGKWHLYISVDTGDEFVWGGLNWDTLLVTADSLEGPWTSHGLVVRRDQGYDATQARDSTIDIVDGRWMCLYKALDGARNVRPALATSFDGITWKKHGVFTTDGEDRIQFISGSIFSGTGGPVFVGQEMQLSGEQTDKSVVTYDKVKIGHGGGYAHFVAFHMDVRNMNLETIYRALWTAESEYEHPEHPCLGYSSLVYDPFKNRMLMYIEALDPKLTRAIGLNETVERVLVYEMKM